MSRALHCGCWLLPVLLLVACTEPEPPSDRPPQVLTVQPAALAGQGERVLAASVMARHESPLGFRTAGRVLSRKVELGQRVEAGQLLGELDPSDYVLSARQAEDQRHAAEIELAQAQRDAARYGRLGAEGALGSAEEERQKARSDAAAARLDASQQQVELARRRTGYASLVAPFGGVVTQLQFEPGLSVSEGQPVLTLADPRELEVVADVPADLQAGLPRAAATATLPGSGTPRVALRLRELAPQANPAARTVRARFSLAGPAVPEMAAAIALGRAVDLHLAEPLLPRAPAGAPSAAASAAVAAQVLPAGALIQAGADPYVYRVDPASGIVVKQPVRVLGYAPEVVEVSGLPEGSRVVAAGAQKLHEGMKVVPVERSASGLDLAPAAVSASPPAGEAIPASVPAALPPSAATPAPASPASVPPSKAPAVAKSPAPAAAPATARP